MEVFSLSKNLGVFAYEDGGVLVTRPRRGNSP